MTTADTPALPKIGERISKAHPELTLVAFARREPERLIALLVRDGGTYRHYVAAMIAGSTRWWLRGQQAYKTFDAALREYDRLRRL